MLQQLPFDIFPAAERVDDLAGQRIFQYRIDCEIPTRAGLSEGHIRVALDDEPAMTSPDLSLTPRQRNVEVLPELVNRKRFADHVHVAEPVEDRAELVRLNTVNLKVPVLWLDAHQLVAHASADEHRTPAAAVDLPLVAEDRAGNRFETKVRIEVAGPR